MLSATHVFMFMTSTLPSRCTPFHSTAQKAAGRASRARPTPSRLVGRRGLSGRCVPLLPSHLSDSIRLSARTRDPSWVLPNCPMGFERSSAGASCCPPEAGCNEGLECVLQLESPSWETHTQLHA